MKRLFPGWIALWCALAAMLPAWAAESSAAKFGKLAKGDTVPAFKAPGADGRPVASVDYKGKPLLVAFCGATGPREALLKLHDEFQSQGLVLMVIFSGTPKDAMEKWAARNTPAPGVVALWDAAARSSSDSVGGSKFGLTTLPATAVINADGKLVGGFVGFGAQSTDFAVSLLVDAGLKLPPGRAPRPSAPSQDLGPPPLENGTVAPDFALVDMSGKTVKLSEFAGKIVVLDFWASWCGPCIASMPHTESVAAATKSQDVVVLGAGTSEERAKFEVWVKANAAKYPTMLFAHDPKAVSAESVSSSLYRVRGIPSQFVIGRDGKVAASIVGYGEGDKRLEEALKALGVKF